MPVIIEQVRTGSHTEFVATDDKGHGYHNTVTDYETVYHDCLAPKEWLQSHEHDLDGYEPTMELSINGKSLSVNGDYKQGAIKNFMSPYITRAKENYTDLRTGKAKVKTVKVIVS